MTKNHMLKHAGFLAALLSFFLACSFRSKQPDPQSDTEEPPSIHLSRAETSELKLRFNAERRLVKAQINYGCDEPVTLATIEYDPNGEPCASEAYSAVYTAFDANAGGKTRMQINYSRYLPIGNGHTNYAMQELFYPDRTLKASGHRLDDDTYEETVWYSGVPQKMQSHTVYKWKDVKWPNDVARYVVSSRIVLDRNGTQQFSGGEFENGGWFFEREAKDGSVAKFEVRGGRVVREVDAKPGSQWPFRRVEWNGVFTTMWLNNDRGQPQISYCLRLKNGEVVVTRWVNGLPSFDQTMIPQKQTAGGNGVAKATVYSLAAVHAADLYNNLYLLVLMQPDGKKPLSVVLAQQREWSGAIEEAYDLAVLPSNRLHNDRSRGEWNKGKWVWTLASNGQLERVSVFDNVENLIGQTVFAMSGKPLYDKGLKAVPPSSLHPNAPAFDLSRQQLDQLPEVDPGFVKAMPPIDPQWFKVEVIPHLPEEPDPTYSKTIITEDQPLTAEQKEQ
jgi:hypothetical protein